MSKLHQIILAINAFSVGLMVPILNLILLDKGASFQTLPLLLAIYSVTVLILELPSGICADLYGRKAVFLLSCGFYFISFLIMIMANNMVALVFAVAFSGLGRSFSSGSLDALMIDQAIDKNGEGCLAGVTTRMAVIEGGALAAGGIAGGFFANANSNYLFNLALREVFIVILFILCLAFVKEQPVHQKEQRIPLIDHIRKSKQVVLSTPQFGFILPGIFFAGFFLCTVETYWQPAFMQIPNVQNSTWILGVITFLAFLAVTLGNIIAQKLLNKHRNREWRFYKFFRIIFAAFILIFAFQKSIIGFMAWYAGVYLLLGASNIAEGTLINKLTPNHMRASVLSLSSFTTQIGVLIASLFSSIMIERLQFAGVWLVAGGLLGGYATFVAVATYKREYESDMSLQQRPSLEE